MEELDAKLAALRRDLESTGGVMVAFSGGADSTFLLAAAVQALGERAVAGTGVSPSLAERELADARALAAELGARHLVVATAEGERYFGLLQSQVRRHYNVADSIPESERLHLNTVVAVRLGRKGEVLDVSLTKPSGNDLFDSAVVTAVRKAAPFSPPPDHLRDTLQKSGVNLSFRPNAL